MSDRGISIRAATLEDAVAIAALAKELGYPADGRTIRERLSRMACRDDQLVSVAESESGEICGWIHAHSSEVLESGFRVEITGMITTKEMRRRGVGRLLVECVEAWAARIGAQVMVVRSNVNREESHRFYQALGFAKTKTQHAYKKRIG